jgi:multiple sugar transport system permease protein
MIDWIESPTDILWAVLASALLAWIAYRRRANVLVWFGAGLGAYLVASRIIRVLIPDAGQHFEPGETPGASYILWSDPAFRSDFALVLLLTVSAALLIAAARRLVGYADETRLSKKGLRLPPPRPWQRSLTALMSAVWLLFPLIVWVGAAVWLVAVSDYTDIVIPALGFVALIALSGGLWLALDGGSRKLALGALVAAVIVGQLRFNATRPPASMFESNGSVWFFIPLIPVLFGVLAAQHVRGTLPGRQYALLAWRIGGLLWLAAVIGWVVRFLGVFDYQSSYAYAVGSLLETPLRVLDLLADLYYDLVPREIADERNVAHMRNWETALAFLGGAAVWLWTAALMQRRANRWAALAGRHWRQLGLQLSLEQKRYMLAFVLILPAVALRTFTSFYPFVQSLILSVQRFNPAFPPRRYYDFRNFEKLSTDLVVRESLEFTLVFVFVSTFFQIVLGLAIAHLLNASFRLRGLARTISLIPWAIPMVVAAIGFKWMFDDQFGLIPDLMRRLFGYEGKWLVDPGTAQAAVIFVNIWKSTPFCALLLLAGLQGISLDLYEAAKVDGANWLDSLRFITVPMLMPIIVTVTMFMLVWQLAVFDLPFAMTGGAPGFSTTVVAQKIYLEIGSLNYSFASAVSISLVFVVTAIGAVGLYTLRRVEVSA